MKSKRQLQIPCRLKQTALLQRKNRLYVYILILLKIKLKLKLKDLMQGM